MNDTDLYMTAALSSFVSACISGLATLSGPHWESGAWMVALLVLMFVATFRLGLSSRYPRPRKLSTMEINLTRLRRLAPAS